MWTHFIRPGCAVHANDVNTQHFYCSKRGLNVGTNEHCSIGFDCHLNPNRNFSLLDSHRVFCSAHSDFDLTQILRSFDENRICAACYQTSHLIKIAIIERVIINVQKRQELRAGANAPHNPFLFTEALGHVTRDLSSLNIQFERTMFKSEF